MHPVLTSEKDSRNPFEIPTSIVEHDFPCDEGEAHGRKSYVVGNYAEAYRTHGVPYGPPVPGTKPSYA